MMRRNEERRKSRFREPYDPGECRPPTRRLLTNGCQFQSTLVLLLTRSKERSLWLVPTQRRLAYIAIGEYSYFREIEMTFPISYRLTFRVSVVIS